ncbi:hypothetical protein [Colwellia sp. RSH04]|uniref:hypothetical protein n=1 Tax=Colwellia sp. RSH04 TaxID=2305464 RepID=UPI000E5708BC|nr:hypothetical protein [Colwellia sp. RSH04]RHW75159.1 hypothetical protein D1094_14970 [Colwellia sp. RSH04]
MLFERLQIIGLLSLIIIGCGSSSDENINNEFPNDDKENIIEEVIVNIEPIDSIWVSGSENVITHWNEDILIPSVTGLLTLNLDDNGYIDEQNLIVEHPSYLVEVQGNTIASLQGNKIIFYHYDGLTLNELYQTEPEELRQVPFTSQNNCFYWVALNKVSSPLSTVKEMCHVGGEFISNSIITTDKLINNIIALPDNRFVTTSTIDSNNFISLYKKESDVFQIKSTVKEDGVSILLDLEYKNDYLYADLGPTDIPDHQGEGGFIRYNLAGNTISDRLKLSDIMTDNAQYDHIAVSPDGIILANDKKLKHFIISNGIIEKIVYAEIENSISSVYVHGHYIVLVLRDPPSSFSTGVHGASGVHIYSLKELL